MVDTFEYLVYLQFCRIYKNPMEYNPKYDSFYYRSIIKYHENVRTYKDNKLQNRTPKGS